jgi:hypothetical protein
VLVVSRAVKGDYGPLDRAEPWVGLDAGGGCGTQFDSYATAHIAAFRHRCDAAPKRREPRPLWTLPPPPARVPLIAFVGGADPQDSVTNLSGLKEHFPDSRTVVFPRIGGYKFASRFSAS